MSVVKMLGRIVAPDDFIMKDTDEAEYSEIVSHKSFVSLDLFLVLYNRMLNNVGSLLCFLQFNKLHDHTYGITSGTSKKIIGRRWCGSHPIGSQPITVVLTHSVFSPYTTDPLTQFAVVFSALIHDVDHTG